MRQLTITFFALAILLTAFACKKVEGDKVQTKAAGEKAVASNTAIKYTIDPAKSIVNWEGSKPSGTHLGTINIKGGSFTMKNETIESGSFTMDMTTIASTDLEGKMKDNLEAHLKGTNEEKASDFFDTQKFPEATFELTKVTRLINDPKASHIINGNLTIKDISKQVGFRAHVRQTGDQIFATSVPFAIDRTEWNIQFMSKKFFDNLKDNFIDDEMGITVNLVANKE